MERWTLDLEGKGSLQCPGQEVTILPYRKVGELLACLYAKRPGALSRDLLANELWPGHLREERFASLRQALSRLKTILGPDAIWSDRRTCRLTTTWALEIRNGVSPSVVGIPEALVLEDVAGPKQSGDLGSQVYAMGVQGSFDWLRTNASSGVEMAPRELKPIVARWNGGLALQPEALPWVEFWTGLSLFSEDLWAGSTRLKHSLRLATQRQDGELVSLASYWLGLGSILVGDFSAASHLASKPRDLVARSFRSGLGRLDSLQSHIYLHQGQTDLATQGLERVVDLDDQAESLRHATQALRALYLAYDGQVRAAERTLAALEPHKDRAENRHLAEYFALAEMVIETMDMQTSSLARAEEKAEELNRKSINQLELYMRELIWVRSLERGKANGARGQMARIRNLRNTIGIAYTAWDRQRLTPATSR